MSLGASHVSARNAGGEYAEEHNCGRGLNACVDAKEKLKFNQMDTGSGKTQMSVLANGINIQWISLTHRRAIMRIQSALEDCAPSKVFVRLPRSS